MKGTTAKVKKDTFFFLRCVREGAKGVTTAWYNNCCRILVIYCTMSTFSVPIENERILYHKCETNYVVGKRKEEGRKIIC